ncbi:hypothetical protein Gotur_027287, partial [Gossypium turneri]
MGGKDVELLRRSGVFIDNWLKDDEEVTKIFNKLGYFVYYDIGARMNKHCKTKWNIWKAKLKIILTLPGRPYHFLLRLSCSFLLYYKLYFRFLRIITRGNKTIEAKVY